MGNLDLGLVLMITFASLRALRALSSALSQVCHDTTMGTVTRGWTLCDMHAVWHF